MRRWGHGPWDTGGGLILGCDVGEQRGEAEPRHLGGKNWQGVCRKSRLGDAGSVYETGTRRREGGRGGGEVEISVLDEVGTFKSPDCESVMVL